MTENTSQTGKKIKIKDKIQIKNQIIVNKISKNQKKIHPFILKILLLCNQDCLQMRMYKKMYLIIVISKN